MLDAVAEQRILRLSIGVTVIVSLFGVVFGLLSGSLSIVFDGGLPPPCDGNLRRSRSRLPGRPRSGR